MSAESIRLAHQLANGEGFPAIPYANESQHHDITQLNLGTMYAHVGIIPARTDRVTVQASGDAEMLSKLVSHAATGVLSLDGDLPFKQSARSSRFFGSRGGSFFSSSSFSASGDNYVVMNGGVVSSQDNGSIVINGQELDTERLIYLRVYVPTGTNIHLRDTVGLVGIAGGLGAQLDLSTNLSLDVYAADTTALRADISGNGEVQIGYVERDADVEISGNGKVTIDRADGDATIDMSGNGNVFHGGDVRGRAKIRLSGNGKVEISGPVQDLSQKISGNGKVIVDGKTYKPKW